MQYLVYSAFFNDSRSIERTVLWQRTKPATTIENIVLQRWFYYWTNTYPSIIFRHSSEPAESKFPLYKNDINSKFTLDMNATNTTNTNGFSVISNDIILWNNEQLWDKEWQYYNLVCPFVRFRPLLPQFLGLTFSLMFYFFDSVPVRIWRESLAVGCPAPDRLTVQWYSAGSLVKLLLWRGHPFLLFRHVLPVPPYPEAISA